MKTKFLLALATLGMVYFSACKKDDNTSVTTTTPAVGKGPVNFKVDGDTISFGTPAAPASGGINEVAITSLGSMYWNASNDTLSFIAVKNLGQDTIVMFMQAKVPSAYLGTYSLNWSGVDITKVNFVSLPFKCYYGKQSDITAALTPSGNVNDPAAIAAFLAQLASYNGTGSVTITGFANNQMSGTFSFTSNLGTGRKHVITEGKFTNVNNLPVLF
jgi:hypothetical protein